MIQRLVATALVGRHFDLAHDIGAVPEAPVVAVDLGGDAEVVEHAKTVDVVDWGALSQTVLRGGVRQLCGVVHARGAGLSAAAVKHAALGRAAPASILLECVARVTLEQEGPVHVPVERARSGADVWRQTCGEDEKEQHGWCCRRIVFPAEGCHLVTSAP